MARWQDHPNATDNETEKQTMAQLRQRPLRGLAGLCGLMAGALALAACGSGDSGAGSANSASSASSESSSSSASADSDVTPSAQSSGRGPSDCERPQALQDIIAAANEEGQINYVFADDPTVLSGIQDAFNKEFGTNITISAVPLRAAEVPTRLHEELSAGKVTVDVAHMQAELFTSLSDNLPFVDKFDWAGTFPECEFPLIDKLIGSDRVLAPATGSAIEFQHLARGVIYNTELVTGDNIPTKWEDLADSKWADGKLAIDPGGSSTVQMVAKWPVDQVVDFSRELMDNKPQWIRGAPSIADAVARGEAYLGITNITNIKDLQDEGLPVDLAPTKWSPAAIQVIFPVKNSPHPNAAKLWAAWMATAGQRIGAQLGMLNERAWPEEDNWSSNILQDKGMETIAMNTTEVIDKSADARKQITEMYGKAGVGE